MGSTYTASMESTRSLAKISLSGLRPTQVGFRNVCSVSNWTYLTLLAYGYLEPTALSRLSQVVLTAATHYLTEILTAVTQA